MPILFPFAIFICFSQHIPMHSCFIGGLRIGKSNVIALNFSYPFAFLRFEDNAVILGWKFLFLKKAYTLPYADIIRVCPTQGLFSRSLQIVHRRCGIPSYICFWCRHPPEIAAIFGEHGVPQK